MTNGKNGTKVPTTTHMTEFQHYHRNSHPTVKPIKLMAYLITLGSREGDIVLDPFMGSGSKGIAAKLLKRHFVGIEMEEEYFKIAEARIKKAKKVRRHLHKEQEAESMLVKKIDDFFEIENG